MSRRAWVGVLAFACAFLVWSARVRVRTVDEYSGLAGRATRGDVLDAGSPTGYAHGQRELIIPGRNEASFHWIAQTQQMFASGEARVRHVDYENAPAGHDVSEASPYRWWLGLVAWIDHACSARPLGLSVERAARVADPLLHLILVVGATLFVAWRFGGWAAALLSIGLVATFPFGSSFLAGAPDSKGLAQICALGSILVLLAGLEASPDGTNGEHPPDPRGSPWPWFALAGVVGGLGIWVRVGVQAPLVAGIVVGGLWAARVSRRGPAGASGALPWRAWALCGAATVLAACMAEYFPGHMGSMNLESVHPLYGVAWVGAGEFLMLAQPRAPGRRAHWSVPPWARALGAGVAVAALPAALWVMGRRGFLTADPSWVRLTLLPAGPVAASSWAWLVREGATPAWWATLVPLAAALPATWLIARPTTTPRTRTLLAVALGPAAVALGFAWARLGWWSILDAALLPPLVVAACAEGAFARAPGRWMMAGIAAAIGLPGLCQLVPTLAGVAGSTLSPQVSEELIDRHLAQWLSTRAGGADAVVFAPPNETTPLWFYGGLRGIGSFARDNGAGLAATLTIAGVPSMDKAEADLRRRAVRFVVIPSWDPFLDESPRPDPAGGTAGRPSVFANELRRLNLPSWLSPVPYQMPVGGGFEGQSVLVLEVVDEQGPAEAASRLAEYLVETGDLDRAASVGASLRRFPGDVGALAAFAQVQGALGNAAALGETLDTLVRRLANGDDRYLPWDRRISLAIVLTQGGRGDLARAQVSRCLGDVSAERLRSLSAGSLYALLVMSRSYGLEIADPGLRGVALDLLPGDLRSRL